MAGTTFLRARSPVTPKITTAHGPAICGSRLSHLSRNGFCHCPEFARVPAGLICRLSGAAFRSRPAALSMRPRTSRRLVLQDKEHVGEINADGFELVEDFLGG